jgi:DNA-binding NarL/FixJ family response regulator
MIRILIFDDSSERRESLEVLFSLQDDMICVGSFNDCTDLIGKIEELQPDIIMMDIRMPVLNGIDATRNLKKKYPLVRVIIQTVSEDEDSIFNSLRAGAEGYILKSTPVEKIVQSIRDVYHGGAVITPSIALRITRFFNTQPVRENENNLSEREREVLQLLTEGLSYKMVAAKLGISYNTVNAHIRKIYQKLSVNSVSEAVSFALKNKII